MKHRFAIVAKTIVAVLFAATLTSCGNAGNAETEPVATETTTENTTDQTETTTQIETTVLSTESETTAQTESTEQTETAEKPETTSNASTDPIHGETETTAQVIPEPTAEDEGGVFDVDRGFFVTKITIPVSLFEDNEDGGSVEEKVAKAKAETDYILNAEINGDNVIYTIKTSEYNKLKRETKADIEKQLDDIVNDSTNTVTRIDYDDDFANIYCYVTSQSEYQKDLNSLGLVGIVLSIRLSDAMMDFFADKTTLHVIDNQTGTEFLTK